MSTLTVICFLKYEFYHTIEMSPQFAFVQLIVYSGIFLY